jgi:hypothetical protein
MLRAVLGVVAGLVVWFVVVTVADRAMRAGWPAYQAVWSANAFTLPMLIARLSESFVASIAAAVVAARIAPAPAVPWALGVVLLAVFIPIHIGLWAKFPVWYHATFLASLPAISVAVGSLARGRRAVPA